MSNRLPRLYLHRAGHSGHGLPDGEGAAETEDYQRDCNPGDGGVARGGHVPVLDNPAGGTLSLTINI